MRGLPDPLVDRARRPDAHGLRRRLGHSSIFAEIIPHWQRFGIQRHFNTMQPDDVARAVVTTVTAPPHMWIPVVEVQPVPPSS